jgi:hypothetical protein
VTKALGGGSFIHNFLQPRSRAEFIAMYQRIRLACDCGRQPAGLRELGLTPDRQLVVAWRCPRCRKQVCVVRPLADYWRECPNPGNAVASQPHGESEDAVFLRSVGIRFSDETG